MQQIALNRLLGLSALLLSSTFCAPMVAAQDSTAAPATAPAAAEKPAVELPKASDIIAKVADALGGREAWGKVKSVEMKGTMEIPAANIKGSMISRSLAPNSMVVVMDLPGFGKVSTGFDGTTAWSVDPTSGPRLLEGDEKAAFMREAAMTKDLDLASHWEALETVGEGKFGGFDCWKVAAKRGGESATLWFEKETGLPRGTEMVVSTQLGKIPVVSTIVEYKSFDAPNAGSVKIGSRTETKQMGQLMVATVETVAINGLDPKSLELPVEVKALLEPEPSEDEDAGAAALAG